MNSAEVKQPVDWMLNLIEQIYAPIRFSDPAFGSKLAQQNQLSGLFLQWLCMCAWRRPDVTAARKNLWDFFKDLSSNIEAGALPQPSWWTSTKTLCEQSNQQ